MSEADLPNQMDNSAWVSVYIETAVLGLIDLLSVRMTSEGNLLLFLRLNHKKNGHRYSQVRMSTNIPNYSEPLPPPRS